MPSFKIQEISQRARSMLTLRQQWGGFERPQDLWFPSWPIKGVYTLRYWRRAVESFEADEPDDGDDPVSPVGAGPCPGYSLNDGSLVAEPFDGHPEM
jgi:hypothetical protein